MLTATPTKPVGKENAHIEIIRVINPNYTVAF